MFLKRSILLFCGILFSLFIHAKDLDSLLNKKPNTDSVRLIPLKEYVITGQYKSKLVEKSVMKVRVLTKENIQRMGAQNLSDLLSNEMNIRLSQDNILGSSMSIQGISGQNVKILVDGIPLIGRQNGNIDLSQINLQQVQRLEIIEGPMSVNYGTDALAGTVNIITNKNFSKKYATQLGAYYESIGQYNLSLGTSVRYHKTSLSVFGARNFFDGWNERDPNFLIDKKSFADSSRFQSWKPKLQYMANADLVHDWKRLKLGLHSDYFFEKIENKGYPRAPYSETAFDDYYYTNRLNQSLNFSYLLSEKLSAKGFVDYSYYKRIKNTYIKDLTELKEQLTANEGDQDTSIFKNLMSRSSIQSVGNKYLDYEIGYDINMETALGVRIDDEKKQQKDVALFASGEYKPFKNMTIRPGIRLTYNSIYKAPLIPSLHLKYDIVDSEEGKDNLAFRFSYGRGFRAPTLKELFFYFVDINHDIQGNPNLKAEKSHSFNASLTYKKNESYFTNQSSVTLFYNSIDNMISLAQLSGTTYSYFNLYRYSTKGIQISNDYSRKTWQVNMSAGIIGRNNLLSPNFQEKSEFSFSPELKTNICYLIEKTNTTVSLFYKYTGKLPIFSIDENQQILQGKNSDYSMMDISVAKPFINKKILLTMGCKNLFNVKTLNGLMLGGAHASTSYSMPLATGRSYFINLLFHFSSKS